MTRPSLPENWQELMAGYALGNLSNEEAEVFQQLLAATPEVNSEIDRFLETLALMPHALPENEPPPHLRDAILNAARSSRQPVGIFQQESRRRPIQNSRSPIWLGIGGAVAAVAILALAVENTQLRQEVQSSKVILAQNDRLSDENDRLSHEVQQSEAILAVISRPGLSATYALAGTDKAAAASGRLIVALDQHQIIIKAQNLPALPQGQAYRLWAVPVGASSPTYCGQFNTSAGGTISTQWSSPRATCDTTKVQMLITAELTSDPLVPKGSLVMKSKA